MTYNPVSEKGICTSKIFGQSGALRELIGILDDPKIRTLDDVLNFKKTYEAVRRARVDDGLAQVKIYMANMSVEMNRLTFEKDELTKCKSEELKMKISRIESELITAYPQHNVLVSLYNKIIRWTKSRMLAYYRNNFQPIVGRATRGHEKRIAGMKKTITHIENNIQTVAEANVIGDLRRLDTLHNKMENEKNLIYGAIGEAKVIDELHRLPKAYSVINDFKMAFKPPLHRRDEDDWIYSIQIDHLVVGPTGIFIIETKNWSRNSISNEALFSPVKQVKRSGFALFIVLNTAIKSGRIQELTNNWGERKISPKQIVVFVNGAPHSEFQYVKVLGIEKMNSCITCGKQEYTTDQIQDIIGFLMGVC